MKALTARQREILEFITQTIEDKGCAPSFREIGRAMGIKSTSGVSDHLKALERKGYLWHSPYGGKWEVVNRGHIASGLLPK